MRPVSNCNAPHRRLWAVEPSWDVPCSDGGEGLSVPSNLLIYVKRYATRKLFRGGEGQTHTNRAYKYAEEVPLHPKTAQEFCPHVDVRAPTRDLTVQPQCTLWAIKNATILFF